MLLFVIDVAVVVSRAEEADKAMAAATAARLTELGKQQKRQARAIEHSRRKADRAERRSDKVWVEAVTAQHQREVAKSKVLESVLSRCRRAVVDVVVPLPCVVQEVKIAKQHEMKTVLLTQAEMKAAAIAAETEAKLREEEAWLQHAKVAEKVTVCVARCR
jgi:exoribonuclease R